MGLNIRIGARDKRFEYLKNYLISVIEEKKKLEFISLHEVSKISTKLKEPTNYETYRSKKISLIKKFKTESQSLDSIFSKWTSLTGRFGDLKWKARLMGAATREERQALWRSMAFMRAQITEKRTNSSIYEDQTQAIISPLDIVDVIFP